MEIRDNRLYFIHHTPYTCWCYLSFDESLQAPSFVSSYIPNQGYRIANRISLIAKLLRHDNFLLCSVAMRQREKNIKSRTICLSWLSEPNDVLPANGRYTGFSQGSGLLDLFGLETDLGIVYITRACSTPPLRPLLCDSFSPQSLFDDELHGWSYRPNTWLSFIPKFEDVCCKYLSLPL